MSTPLVPCARCGSPLGGEVRMCPRCGLLQPSRESIVPGLTIERGDTRLVVDVRIGEGAMGVVWRAWVFHAPVSGRAADPPQLVALKVLRPQAMAYPGVRELFLREGEALARLSHPNVVGFKDLFEHEGALVLSLEYVEGQTLAEVVARHVARSHAAGAVGLPAMPLLRAWSYFQQLLGALAAIHALGIVHRDVKPSNVLIRGDGLVKLGDFGIARFRDAPATRVTTELAPGTGAYMSPEQVLGRRVDDRSDLYSAATVLYEVLAGRTPFDDDRPEILVRKDQVDAPPPPVRRFLPQAPPILDALFARALAKNPADRFESAIEMGDAFRRALGLPETPEWHAQAELAREARTLLDAHSPSDASPHDAQQSKLQTLREFVVSGYKTMKLASM